MGHYYYTNYDNSDYFYFLRAQFGATGQANGPLLMQYLLYLLLVNLGQGPCWGHREGQWAITITIIMITVIILAMSRVCL